MAVRVENTPEQIAILDHRFQVVADGAVQWSVVVISEPEVEGEVWLQAPLIREVSRVDLIIQRLNVRRRGIPALRIDQVEGLISGADDAAEQIAQRISAREIGGVDTADLSGRQARRELIPGGGDVVSRKHAEVNHRFQFLPLDLAAETKRVVAPRVNGVVLEVVVPGVASLNRERTFRMRDRQRQETDEEVRWNVTLVEERMRELKSTAHFV